jgi:hypothetical protein
MREFFILPDSDRITISQQLLETAVTIHSVFLSLYHFHKICPKFKISNQCHPEYPTERNIQSATRGGLDAKIIYATTIKVLAKISASGFDPKCRLSEGFTIESSVDRNDRDHC